MNNLASAAWKKALNTGLISGILAIMISLIGMVESFGDTFIINRFVSLGDILHMAPILILIYGAIKTYDQATWKLQLAYSTFSGAIAGLMLTVLVLFGSAFDIREMLVNASPTLFLLLMFGIELPGGAFILILKGALLGTLAIGLYRLQPRWRNAIMQGIMWVALIGTLRDQILLASFAQIEPLNSILRGFFFAQSGLTQFGGILLFLIVVAAYYFLGGRKKVVANNKQTPEKLRKSRLTRFGIAGIALLLLPPVLGLFFSEVLDSVGLFILMSLGLNIVVGFAGLLDLGYVGFYAIGAYTMAVFTSPEMGFFNLSFWQALPIALLFSVLAGVILGLPVLRMRGDYLAIVTLGFGEIIRLLALSDWLKPWLGGTQGIQRIAHPQIGPIAIDTLQEIYYLILLGIGLVAFVSIRLKDSKVGRAWMAIREDEDVAAAMGINPVFSKLMAFATGALFAGLSGSLLGAKLTSVYPHSFTFIVSINVLSIIIIGGMGSIPGVLIGGLVLMGLPGVLTEFEEYRWLFYGAALVMMMLTRPEGLWPETRRKLELHEAEEEVPEEDLTPAIQSGD
jgi:branched-chain amino acid transport system permease protein